MEPSSVGDAVEDLQRALEALPDEDDHADDIQLWKSDLGVLSARVTESQSVEEFLYEPGGSRPAPDDLNPALERIDARFQSECGFAARS